MTDASAPAAPPQPPLLTPHVPMKRVIILVNPLSGGVGPQAAAEAEAVRAAAQRFEEADLVVAHRIDLAARRKPGRRDVEHAVRKLADGAATGRGRVEALARHRIA